MPRLYTKTLLALFAAAIFLGIFFAGSDPKGSIYNDESFQRAYQIEKNKLEEAFSTESPEKAYSYFREAYLSNPDQAIFHNLGHWVGYELYMREGIEGMKLCDETGSYGCYHGFFGSSYAKEGEAIFEKTKYYCQTAGNDPNRTLECLHGIGHGLISINGHNDAAIVRSLDICSKLSEIEFYNGVCYGGVFMEYNIRTMEGINENGFSVRPLDPLKPYDPCDSLPAKNAFICYKELPYWWASVSNNNLDYMNKLCAKIPEAGNRTNCFRGVGRTIPWMNGYNTAKTYNDCITLGENTYITCIISASERLVYKYGLAATSLCDNLNPDEKDICVSKIEVFACEMLNACRKKT